jgi:hypothetical protein
VLTCLFTKNIILTGEILETITLCFCFNCSFPNFLLKHFFSIWLLYRGFHCYISIYTYIVPSLVHSLHYSPSSPTPFLKMTLTGFSVPYSYMHGKFLNHIHPHLPSPSCYYPPLNGTCFTFLSFIILVSVHCSLGFCLGILPVNILCFNQSNHLYYSSLPFSLNLETITLRIRQDNLLHHFCTKVH